MRVEEGNAASPTVAGWQRQPAQGVSGVGGDRTPQQVIVRTSPTCGAGSKAPLRCLRELDHLIPLIGGCTALPHESGLVAKH